MLVIGSYSSKREVKRATKKNGREEGGSNVASGRAGGCLRVPQP